MCKQRRDVTFPDGDKDSQFRFNMHLYSFCVSVQPGNHHLCFWHLGHTSFATFVSDTAFQLRLGLPRRCTAWSPLFTGRVRLFEGPHQWVQGKGKGRSHTELCRQHIYSPLFFQSSKPVWYTLFCTLQSLIFLEVQRLDFPLDGFNILNHHRATELTSRTHNIKWNDEAFPRIGGRESDWPSEHMQMYRL